MPTIRPIQLPIPGLEDLHAEAQSQGYHFLDTLIDDWASGAIRFDHPGEALFGVFEDGTLIAIGGLTIDPFLPSANLGRIRRVFVRAASRNQGVGQALMRALIGHARRTFPAVRLRAENADAARLYERLGFLPIDDPNASHILRLTTEN